MSLKIESQNKVEEMIEMIIKVYLEENIKQEGAS
jgi:hypothetical protein